MKNMVELATNKVMNEMVEEAIRQAAMLQSKANKEYNKQKALQEAGEKYDFTVKHHMEEGARALCQVLWTLFGGCPMDSISAIEKMVRENESEILGYDCQDYIALFTEAFEG